MVQLRKQILLLSGLLVILTALCLFLERGSLILYVSGADAAGEILLTGTAVEVASVQDGDGYLEIRLEARERGDAELKVISGESSSFFIVHVLPLGILHESSTELFSGYVGVTVLQILYLASVIVLIIRRFIRMQKSMERFSYDAMYMAGLGIFLGLLLINMIVVEIRLLREPWKYLMYAYWSQISTAGTRMIFPTFPLLAVFAAVLLASTAVLIRKEGFGTSNLYALLVGAAGIAGILGYYVLNGSFSGSLRDLRIFLTILSIYTSCFLYVEAMLIGLVVSTAAAVNQRIPFDRDYIIILGCGIDKNGKPYPLLQGRIDCALRFAEAQQAAGGPAPIFVPSGGQGRNECVSEAEAIRQYLLAQGIPDSRILIEDRSTNTQENMRFSKTIIDAQPGGHRAVFATNRFHVFRSGIFSRECGLNAPGIGSRTRWYFALNAFMREFLGVMGANIRRHLRWMIGINVFFAILAYILAM